MLEQHKDNPSVHRKLSELQAGAIAQILGNASLTDDQKADVALLLVNLQWACEADRDKAMVLLKPSDEPTKKKARRLGQDYTTMHNYFTDDMWKALLDEDTPADVKLTAILGHAMNLGMRLPSEPTVKWLTSMHLVMSMDKQSLRRMDSVRKAICLKNTKQKVEAMRRRSSEPHEWLMVLPESPLELSVKHKVLYGTGFPDGSMPTEPQVPIELLSGFDLSYACRGGLRHTVPFGSPTRNSASSHQLATQGPQAADFSGFERLAATFLQSLQSSQQNLISILAENPSHRRPAISLSTLEDRSVRQGALAQSLFRPAHLTIQDLSHQPHADSPPQLALGPPDGSPLGSQPQHDGSPSGSLPAHGPFARRPSHDGSPFGSPLAQMDESQSPSAGSKSAGTASGVDLTKDVNAILDMLRKRKCAKPKAVDTSAAVAEEAVPKPVATKRKKDCAKPKAAVMCVPKASEAAPTVPTKAKKGGAKPQAAEMCVPKASGAPPAVSGAPPAAKTSGTPQLPLAKAAAVPASLEVAKAAAKAGTRRAWLPSDGFGCGKCRWKVNGCSQCKADGFSGFRWNPTMRL